MKSSEPLLNLGFSKYEITAYLTLVTNHPVNGSQLSRMSAIPRAKIYDVLRSLKGKGAVTEVGEGLYAPLPPEELFSRIRHNFETSIAQDFANEHLNDHIIFYQQYSLYRFHIDWSIS